MIDWMNPTVLLRKELAPLSNLTGTGWVLSQQNCYKTSVDLLDNSKENAEISWGIKVPLKKPNKQQNTNQQTGSIKYLI